MPSPKDFKDTIKNIPHKPGVYRYYSKGDEILYIGKAKDLKNRVSSYFQEGRPRNQRLTLMISQIDRIEYTVVDSEKESLILEANLINSLQPRYNIQLKDDRSYVYVRITDDPIPGIFLTRSKYDPNSKYFGPYTKKSGIYNTLQTIRTIFPFCQEKTPTKRPCNYYSIKQCEGICAGLEDKHNYQAKLEQIKNILSGRTEEVQEYLFLQINEAIQNNNYELAGLWRDKLKTLVETIADQKIVLPHPQDIDLITLVIENNSETTIGSVFVQNIRGGRIINVNNFLLTGSEDECLEYEYIQRFLSGYFNKKVDLVEVLVQIYKKDNDKYNKFELTSNEVKSLKSFLGIKISQRNHQPKNRQKLRELLDLSKQNTIIYLDRNKLGQRLTIFEENNLFKAVVDLQAKLKLPKIPRRIECYDISHLSGKFVYGSMVVFIDGRASKKNYKLFKTTERNDDFANHKEVLSRRFERCLQWRLKNKSSSAVNQDQKIVIPDFDPESIPTQTKSNPWELPDLIIVDGGKGQLSSDLEVLDEYQQKFQQAGLEFEVEMAALAKREEEIFLPYNPEPVILSGETMFLVQRIRDEAHRFAITNNRKARLKTASQSELDNIPGIGPSTKQKLLSTFGSKEKILDAIYKNPELLIELLGESKFQKIKEFYYRPLS